jgi:lysophospholipase L1-like esterase
MLGRFTRQRITDLEDAIGQPVVVLNGAAGGWDSTDCARRAPVLARCAPAVVVLSVGTNDCAPWRQVPLDTFARNLAAVRAGFAGSDLVSFLPPTVHEPSNRAADARPARSNVALDRYRAVLRDTFSARRRLDVPELLARHSDVEVLESDGLHLTARSYDLLIPELARLVTAALADRKIRS